MAPGEQIEIRILDYDRHSGTTTFAARKEVPGETGDIVIDFRWLVQRCLEWFQNRGASIPEVTAIQGWPVVGVNSFAPEGEFSDKQIEAVRTILTSRVSYVWGPPGTGKTQRVLTLAACHCVKQDKRVLVLASTNLAVDNALTAIIQTGLDKEKVARIGVPSKDFIRDYPECCEQRAFEHEIRQVQSQIKTLNEKKVRFKRARELEDQIGQDTLALDENQRLLNKSQAGLATAEDGLRNCRVAATQAQAQFDLLQDQVVTQTREIEDLGFPELVSDIQALEADQTRTIKKAEKVREELRNLGLLSRVFTGREKRLQATIASDHTHLQSVEATLNGKRKRYDAISPKFNALKEEIARLHCSLENKGREIAAIRDEVSGVDLRCGEFKTAVDNTHEVMRRIKERLHERKNELSGIEECYPAQNAEADIAKWDAEIKELLARLARFRQDLALKSLIGMTLDGFIGFSQQMGIKADLALIDEAPYAPLAKVLPLLTLNCPIAMLGDHLQLPPICECKNDPIIRAYWAKPAVFLEDAFRLGADYEGLQKVDAPQCELTKRCTLKDSYRFGKSLASLLDRHIYRIGLRGLGETTITCIDCPPRDRPDRLGRQNDAEADAIIDYIEARWSPEEKQKEHPTIAILTPYKNQVELIRSKLIERFGNSAIRYHVQVLNTHKAQGREWDWVLFSASDTRNLPGNDPFFSDSANPRGKRVLNTTISRTRNQLVVFLDAEYWRRRRPDSILKELALNMRDS
jgi:archaellum component FlaC